MADDDGFLPQLSQLVGLDILKPFMLEQPVEASRATAKMNAVSDVNREKLVHMPEMSFEMEYWKGALALREILVRQTSDAADSCTGT